MNQMYDAYPPQSFPQGANALGGWQNPQSMGYQGFGNQNGFQQPYRSGMPGRVVQDITEVRPNEVPGDGSPAIFVKNDMSCVYVKYLSNVGKIETLVYEQAANKAISPETSEMEEIRQKLDELLRLTQKRNKPYHKPPYRTDKKGERNETDAE